MEITESPHAEAAKALVEKLRALRAELPQYVPESPGDAKSLANRASVPEPFVESASVAIQASDLLDGSTRTTAEALRDVIAFALAYEAVLTEGKAFVRAAKHMIRLAKSQAGGHALSVYAIAQRLAKEKDGAELVPHVIDMRHKLKRGRRKATSEPAPDPVKKTAPNL